MRFVEIRGGLRLPISNEELLVSEKVRTNMQPYPKGSLNLRERELARQLVHRGVLDRVMIDEEIHFVYNDEEDLRR